MASHLKTSHRHKVESPDQACPSMDPTLKKQTKLSSITKNPDPIINKSSFYGSSRLKNPTHRKPKAKSFAPPPPASVDIYLQAKAMTVSADYSDSTSKLLFQQSKKNVVPKLEDKEGSKEKPKKTKKEKFEELGVDLNNKLSVKDKQDANRRKSFCGSSQIELVDVLANCGVKVVSADMPPFMQIHAVDCARKTVDSLEKFTSKTLALTLKKEFDGVYGPAWHCIVGKSFGSFVTHSVGGFLYFSMDQKLHVLLFKTTVQRAD
ncbi:hypothetical protein ACFE04_027704 [Oxalis oulophora]